MDINDQLEQQEQRVAEHRLQALLDDNDFAQVLSSPEGRRFVRRVLGECGVYQASFTGDALTSAYREGRRSMGLWLTGLFEPHPETYIQTPRHLLKAPNQ